jgi:hypothetical protein
MHLTRPAGAVLGIQRSESLMVVNGGALPDPARLGRVEWSDECVWRAAEPNFVLMSACYHGADPDKGPHFKVRLEPGEYVVQRGSHGWADDDPAPVLFRFVQSGRAERGAAPDGGGTEASRGSRSPRRRGR